MAGGNVMNRWKHRLERTTSTLDNVEELMSEVTANLKFDAEATKKMELAFALVRETLAKLKRPEKFRNRLVRMDTWKRNARDE